MTQDLSKGFVVLSLNTVMSFFGASLLLAAAPGPDILFVLTQSLAYGKKAGLWVSFGNVMGLIVHTALVAMGVGALISASPVAFNTLKYIGASYLVYLAYKAFTAEPTGEVVTEDGAEVSTKNLFVRGAIVSITNPHVTVLFLAFLPQFIDPALGQVWLQVTSLGFIFMVAAFMVFAAVALASGVVRRKLAEKPSRMRVVDRVAAVVFFGLAIKLFVD